MNTNKKQQVPNEKEPVPRKKPGPKGKPESEKLARIVPVRFTIFQYSKLMKDVGPLTLKHNIRIGDLIRLRLFPENDSKIKRLSETIPKVEGGTNRQLIEATTQLHLTRNELIAVGRNLNQVVKKLHETDASHAPSVNTKLQRIVDFEEKLTTLINQCETINANLLAWYQS